MTINSFFEITGILTITVIIIYLFINLIPILLKDIDLKKQYNCEWAIGKKYIKRDKSNRRNIR
jgi:hypothetical protein